MMLVNSRDLYVGIRVISRSIIIFKKLIKDESILLLPFQNPDGIVGLKRSHTMRKICSILPLLLRRKWSTVGAWLQTR